VTDQLPRYKLNFRQQGFSMGVTALMSVQVWQMRNFHPMLASICKLFLYQQLASLQYYAGRR